MKENMNSKGLLLSLKEVKTQLVTC